VGLSAHSGGAGDWRVLSTWHSEELRRLVTFRLGMTVPGHACQVFRYTVTFDPSNLVKPKPSNVSL
jgi:hypothetical protein